MRKKVCFAREKIAAALLCVLVLAGVFGMKEAAQATCTCTCTSCTCSEISPRMILNQEPVDLLTKFEPFYNERCSISSNGKDNLGNEYRKYIYSASYYNAPGGISFYLGGEYEGLTGTVFLREKKKSTDHASWMKIYGDGQLLYASPEFTAKTLPADFVLDVRGIKELELVIDVDSYGSGGGIIGVGDLLLYQ